MLNHAVSAPQRYWSSTDYLAQLLCNTSREADTWPQFLEQFRQHFNLNACHLILLNNATNAILTHLHAGKLATKKYADAYHEKYRSQDMVIHEARTSTSRKFFATNLWDKKELYYNSSFYQNWALPQGLIESGAACIFAENDWRCILVHNRTKAQGKYDLDDIAGMNDLVPHLERAIKACYMRDQLNQHNTRTRTILEGYRTPVAIITEFGKVWGTNRLMEDLLQHENSLYIRDGILRAQTLGTDRAITTAIMNSASANKDALPAPMFVDVSEGIRLHFCGIRGKHNNLKTNKGVLLFAISRNYRTHVSVETLMGMFSLTPSEAAVCKYILEGKELREIAEIRSKSVNTIREQLYQSFKKTGCSSQTALVNMLTSIPVLDC